MPINVAVLVAFGTLAAGCGGHASVPLPTAAGSGHSGTTASLRIDVPRGAGGSAATAARRSPRYVSPATQSVTVVITQHAGGATVLNETVGLTPTSTGCTSTLTTTICTLNLPLAPGTYDMSLATYDGYDSVHGTATGTMLSSGQNIGFSILAGRSNTVSVTLSGIPASIAVSSTAAGVRGSLSTFTQYATNPEAFSVVALDPDGDVIIGPGAPTFTIASTGGTAFTITNPMAGAPNTFSLTATGSGGTVGFTATAHYTDATCATAGATCTATFAVTSVMQTLFVSNTGGNSITTYPPPYGTPSATAAITSPAGIAADGTGILYAGQSTTSTLYRLAPPYTSAGTSGFSSGAPVAAVVVTPDAYPTILAMGGSSAIAIPYPFVYSVSTLTGTGNGMKGPSLDAASDVFIANASSNSITEYAPPYTGSPVATITNGVRSPQQTVIDGLGDLFVANVDTQSSVTEYASGSFGAPIATITTGVAAPYGIAMDHVGNLFVANGNDTVTVYAPPYTGTPTTISSSISRPEAIVVDGAGDLFVANNGNNTVTEYTAPYTAAPVTTISAGVNGPQQFSLAFYPQ